MTLPIAIMGIAGTIYYQDVIRQNIWDDNLGSAVTISALTSEYMNSSQVYLGSVADSSLVVSAFDRNDISYLHNTAIYVNRSSRTNGIYFINGYGMAITGTPPLPGLIGSDFKRKPYVINVLLTGNPYIGDAQPGYNNIPVVPIGVPIKHEDNRVVGAVVGYLNLSDFSSLIQGTNVKNGQYIYLVNRTGHVMAHNSPRELVNMTDYSSLPSVQRALRGERGVMEQYSPIEKETRLTAYVPLKSLGWGVIVSLPDSVAYQPVRNATWFFIAIMIGLMLLAIALGLYIGGGISNPIINLSKATKKMEEGGDYHKLLPLGRNDEIGELARSFESMSGKITEDNRRVRDEKDRAELYVDILGHDINNLNQSIIGNLELLKGGGEGLTKEQREELINKALISAMGSSGIIDNVRKIQRINEEKMILYPEDINDMIQACIKEAPRPKGKKVTISYAPKKGLMVKSSSLMKEVFCNIIGNSIKYSGNEVAIDIRVDEAARDGKKFYDITIADNGHGISDELKPRLFARFVRGTTKSQGKGLGLFIAKSLVEQAGGDVRVEDRIPGDYSKGARFIVSLPACEDEK